jgi:hypothetical protein
VNEKAIAVALTQIAVFSSPLIFFRSEPQQTLNISLERL